MKLNLQKTLATKIARVGKKRIKINPAASEDVKAAITKADVGSLIAEGKIEILNKRGVSRVRAKKLHAQQKKGRRKGHGSRKGAHKARTPKKRTWINKIRLQRKTLRELKDTAQIEPTTYRRLYSLAKGGFFRSKKHLLLYAEKNKMIKKIQTPKPTVKVVEAKK
jgi:large subunit ribosomal protein L19e